MLFRLILLICLFEYISNLIIPNNSFQYNRILDNSLLPNKNIPKIYLKKGQMHVKWHDIIFISVLILSALTLLLCLYYQRFLIHFIFTLCSKTKNNNDAVNEHVTILHQTPPLTTAPSMYLTVPEPSYFHH
jgi:hypothetical protein